LDQKLIVSRCFRVIGVLAIALSIGACQKDATQLVVLVDTDFRVPSELTFVQARISDLDGQEISASEFALTDVPDPADPARFVVPFSFGVVPFDGDASRRIVVDVDGLGPSRELKLTRRAITGFLSEQSLLLPMFLARSCEDVICSDEDQTCTERGCVSVFVDPGGLVAITPGEELLDTGLRPDSAMDSAMDSETDSGTDSGTDSDTGVDTGADAGTPLMCDTTACTCDVGYCAATCTSAGRCELGCSDLGCTVDATGTSFLDFDCTGNASCVVDAQMVSNVIVTCADNSTCAIDCRDTPSCIVRCTGAGAQCTVQCAGSSDCMMPTCTAGGFMMCPSNVLVCGTLCP